MIADSTAQTAPDSVSDSVTLVSLSPTEWRVSDPRASAHDAASLLGFIEARGGSFEVTVLNHGVASYTAPSLDGALALFASKRDSRRLSPNVGGTSRSAMR